MKLSPIDIVKDNFVLDKKFIFDPSKLDINNFQKNVSWCNRSKDKVCRWDFKFKHSSQCPGFLSRKKSGEDTCYKLWADVDNELLQNKKLKFSYYLFLVQKTKFLLDDIWLTITKYLLLCSKDLYITVLKNKKCFKKLVIQNK